MRDLITSLTDNTSRVLQQANKFVVLVDNFRHRAGTGIVWCRNHHGCSLIITNNHIVDRIQNLRISTADNKEFPAQVVARDSVIDLALLRINSTNLTEACVADAGSSRVGELVFAIGNPLGQRSVVTAGLISSLGKLYSTGNSPREIEVIRSDARLAPGNSGGPMLNAAGDVVGVSTMIIGGDQGIAISANLVKSFYEGAISGLDGCT